MAGGDNGGNNPGVFRAFRAVISAFVGIGKGEALQNDLATLRPWHVIVAGLILAALFVGVIVMVVRNIAT